jgi:hypothetical protein
MAPRAGLASRLACALGGALRSALPQTPAPTPAPSRLAPAWGAARGFLAAAAPLPPAMRLPGRELAGLAAAAAWPSRGAGALRGFAASAEPSLKVYKPTSPGQRGRVTTSRKGLHKGRPMRGLVMVRDPPAARPARATPLTPPRRTAGADQERRAQQPRAHHVAAQRHGAARAAFAAITHSPVPQAAARGVCTG